MANEEHLAILRQGVDAWNKWRSHVTQPLLSGAGLSGADLARANLAHTLLSRADLAGASLDGADLAGASLGGADLSGAGLVGANLYRADLRWANLTDTDLTGSDFAEASVGETLFANVDLSTATDLERVRHVRPSTVGIDTLYRSQGKIPEVFLRGCGVPEDFITYAHSLIGKAIEFYSCFISYSSKDDDFAQRLHSRMRDAGLRVWFAPRDMKGGKKTHDQIDDAIRLHDKLLLILSEHSMASEWVKTEIHKARLCEVKEKRQILFPIRLTDIDAIRAWEAFDAHIGKDSAREILEYHIPNWKDHDAFEAAFADLLRDLRKDTSI